MRQESWKFSTFFLSSFSARFFKCHDCACSVLKSGKIFCPRGNFNWMENNLKTTLSVKILHLANMILLLRNEYQELGLVQKHHCICSQQHEGSMDSHIIWHCLTPKYMQWNSLYCDFRKGWFLLNFTLFNCYCIILDYIAYDSNANSILFKKCFSKMVVWYFEERK